MGGPSCAVECVCGPLVAGLQWSKYIQWTLVVVIEQVRPPAEYISLLAPLAFCAYYTVVLNAVRDRTVNDVVHDVAVVSGLIYCGPNRI